MCVFVCECMCVCVCMCACMNLWHDARYNVKREGLWQSKCVYACVCVCVYATK